MVKQEALPWGWNHDPLTEVGCTSIFHFGSKNRLGELNKHPIGRLGIILVLQVFVVCIFCPFLGREPNSSSRGNKIRRQNQSTLFNSMLKEPCLKFPKSAINIFGLKITPPPSRPPFKLFRKFIRFGSPTRPYHHQQHQ